MSRSSEPVEAVNTFSNPQDQRSEHRFLLFVRGMHAGGGWDAAEKLEEPLAKSLRLDVKVAARMMHYA